MNSQNIPEEFRDIRPYAPDELPEVLQELLHDDAFMSVATRLVPDLDAQVNALMDKASSDGGDGASPTLSNLAVQKAFFYPLIEGLLHRCSAGIDLALPQDFDRSAPHTFITNHRDIVLDSALLSYLLVQSGFDSTVEIAIGDNLLIYPWIKKLVRVNKSFVVQRSLHMREMLRASQVMSRYMHFVVREKRDNIWIAQREGRAKDSNDRTQESLLKMMAMGGEGSVLDRLRELRLTPMALSYEYDPCDFLKAREFQQRRDTPDFRKSQADDLRSMSTGIFGQKGRIHFEAAPCINAWLDTIDPSTPKNELFPLIAEHIDSEIFRSYRLFPGNYVAADELTSAGTHASRYTADERSAFLEYVESRVAMVELPQPDAPFLRQCILTMYANPVFNNEAATAARNAD